MARFCPKNLLNRCRVQDLNCEQKWRAASEACVAASAISLAASVLVWLKSGCCKDRARSERLAIFTGLWVPSLLLASSYLTRKADDEALRSRDDIPFFEETM